MAGEDQSNFQQNFQQALSSAGDSARARIEAAPAEPAVQPQPEPAPAQPPEPAPAQPPTHPEPPPATPQKPFYEFKRGERVLGLSEDDVNILLNFAADAYEEAARGGQQSQEEEGAPPERPETKPTQPPGQQPDAEIVAQLKELQKKQKEIEKAQKTAEQREAAKQRESEIKQIMESIEQLYAKDEVLKTIPTATEDKKLAEQDTRVTKAFITFLKGYTGEDSLEAAAQKVTGLLERYAKHKSNKLIQSKIEQGSSRVEGSGGGVPVPGPKQFTSKDFLGGKVMEAAYERAAKALMQH